MKRLAELADVLRSKNAGPLNVTFDLMFQQRETYEHVLHSGIITPELIAKIYNVSVDEVVITPYEIVNSIKITIPRKYVSGDVRDDDIYGCQQHTPLADILIP
jgi:hypothetical protein